MSEPTETQFDRKTGLYFRVVPDWCPEICTHGHQCDSSYVGHGVEHDAVINSRMEVHHWTEEEICEPDPL